LDSIPIHRIYQERGGGELYSTYLIFLLILSGVYVIFEWIKFRGSVTNSDGEKEISDKMMPFLLWSLLFVLFLLMLFF